MGKKLSTKTTAKPPAKQKAAPPAKAERVPPAAKAKKATSKPINKPARAKKPFYTSDDVARRAYYLAESRHRAGLPGNPQQDWIEAERQLAAETKPPRRLKLKKG